MATAAARHRRPAFASGTTAFGFAVLAVGALALLAVLAGTADVRLHGALVQTSSRPASLRQSTADEAAAAPAAAAASGHGSSADSQASDSGSNAASSGSSGSREGSARAGQAVDGRGELRGNGADGSLEPGSSLSSSGSDATETESGSGGSQESSIQPVESDGAAGRAATPHPGATAASHSEVEVSCSEALGIKRVALLFLTTRRLAHEKLWRLWMWDAAGLAAVCEAPPEAAAASWRRLRAACTQRPPDMAVTAGAQPELPPQLLFNIYVHAPPDYAGLEYQPLFQRRLIPQRLRTWWGTASITDAERLLLAAALADPANEKFLLISDHDIPLYDPLTLYQQMLHEPRSRVVACPNPRSSIDRWKDGMATDRLKKHHWRKSNQFFSLTRAHAEAVVRDTEIYRAFKERCGGRYPDGSWKECVPDEHYIPTLLAVLGLENETYCDGWGLAYTDWSEHGNHPRSFKPKHVTPALLKTARWSCAHAREAAEDAESLFLHVDQLLGGDSGGSERACSLARDAGGGGNSSSSGTNSSGYAHALSGACPMTARKFPPYTSMRVRQLFLSSCPPGTGQVRSKAATTFGVARDPDLVLLRGQACTRGAEQLALGRAPRKGGAAPARRLLCMLRLASVDWLPSRDAFHPPFLDRLDAACDAG